MRVTIYNEFTCNQREECCLSVYPQGLHMALKELCLSAGHTASVVTLESVAELTEQKLTETDVLIWWGHCSHADVPDEIANRVVSFVQRGMGVMFLHSAHFSKPFTRLMGTSCSLKWREIGERERLWVVDPTHPIVKGLPEQFVVEHEEMYGERFDVPAPDELVLLGWFQGGEVFRSGITYKRGLGKIFYFQPGHETLPTYYNESVRKVILNAIDWLAPTIRIANTCCPNPQPLESL